MTTVAELIKKLQTLPQDAEVEVLKEYSYGYQTSTSFEPIDIEFVDVLDYTDEIYAKSHIYGKIFVHLAGI